MDKKQDLRVLFVFGPHGDVEDAERSISILDKYRPDIYSPEIPVEFADRRYAEKNILEYIENSHTPNPGMKACARRFAEWAQDHVPIKILEDRLTEEERDSILINAGKYYPFFYFSEEELSHPQLKDSVLSMILQAGAWLPGLEKVSSYDAYLRERKIINNILSGQFVEELASDGIDLRGYDEIRIAMTIGSYHEPMYRDFINDVKKPHCFKKIIPHRAILDEKQLYTDPALQNLLGIESSSSYDWSEDAQKCRVERFKLG
ncbi:MAG: hypothetical protein QMD85_02470 [Candidatus Aenigmarchaeota archaeon]|nr:hypothetical protein [Candidatus Aenigmarchaeota archaeon]MDI6722408.1 hypothetical protein [Candidatus Aenigmarchaeota archaeon]